MNWHRIGAIILSMSLVPVVMGCAAIFVFTVMRFRLGQDDLLAGLLIGLAAMVGAAAFAILWTK